MSVIVTNESPSNRALFMRQRLRQKTGATHSILDAAIGPLTSEDSYRSYLSGLLNFREYVEQFLKQTSVDAAVEWKPQLLTDSIRGDLQHLDHAGVRRTLTGLQKNPTRHYILGVYYVLEGSALGARLLFKQVAKLGYSAARGANHLRLQTDDERRWPRFLSVLESVGAEDPEEVERGATDAFVVAFDAWGVSATTKTR